LEIFRWEGKSNGDIQTFIKLHLLLLNCNHYVAGNVKLDGDKEYVMEIYLKNLYLIFNIFLLYVYI